MSLEDEARQRASQDKATSEHVTREARELAALFKAHKIPPMEFEGGEFAWVVRMPGFRYTRSATLGAADVPVDGVAVTEAGDLRHWWHYARSKEHSVYLRDQVISDDRYHEDLVATATRVVDGSYEKWASDARNYVKWAKEWKERKDTVRTAWIVVAVLLGITILFCIVTNAG